MSNGQISGGEGRFRISGELSFKTVNLVLEESRDSIFAHTGPTVEIDLGEVSRADSAGLALLLQWMRMARSSQLNILFRHLPEQLLAIAHAGDLEELLPVGE